MGCVFTVPSYGRSARPPLLSGVLAPAIVVSVWFIGVATAETVEFTVSSSFSVRFEKNHVVFYERSGGGGGGRGFTVAAVDPASSTGNVIAVRTFDTWLVHCSEHDRLIEFIDNFPIGTLFLIAVADEAGLVADACSEQTRRALEVLGSTQIRNYQFRNKWAMIAVKGEGRAIIERLSSAAPPVVVEARLAFPLGSPTPSSPRALWCGSPEIAPPFQPIDVTVEDASGNHVTTVQVLRPTLVCAPSGMNTKTEPPTTVDSWIVCYDLSGIPLNPHASVHVQTALALGRHALQVGSIHTVCIPARP